MEKYHKNDAKVQALHEEARIHDQKAQESWERSGTDGFVSQWAHGIEAQLARKQAEIEENGGTYRLLALYQGDEVVDAHLVDGPYGLYWSVESKEQARALGGHSGYSGRWSVPFDNSHEGDSGSRSKVQEKLGLVQRWGYLPAKAIIVSGGGTGLSGAAQAQVAVVRKETVRK